MRPRSCPGGVVGGVVGSVVDAIGECYASALGSATMRDWHAIQKLYVFGEIVRVHEDGSEVRRFPSIRELSARLRIARSVIGNRARRDDWVVARARFQGEHRAATWQKLVDLELGRDTAGRRSAAGAELPHE
jgi:hypothetical protein